MSGAPETMKDLNRRKYSQQIVSQAISYVRHGRVPSRLRSSGTRGRFRERWEGFEARKREQDTTDSESDSDEHNNNNNNNNNTYHLFYGDKRVVPTDEVAEIVSAHYNDAKTTGGRDRIYARLFKQYIGISRRAVMDALRNQEIWQLLRRPHAPRAKHAVRQPVLAQGPWQRLQIDLIDMSRWANWNHGKHWALTVVDVFTKQAFAVPLRDKTGARVAKAFEEHVLEEHDEVPSIVQSDNGGEFRNHEFAELAARRGFKQVFSSSYSPQSNGGVERFNQTLKMLIRHHFVASGTKSWIQVLPDLLENYGSAQHSSTKFSPDELVAAWKQHDDVTLAKARANLVKRAKRSLGTEPGPAIRAGDHVRTLVAKRKRPQKSGETKLRRPVWSEHVREVKSVSSPTKGTSLPQYTLEGTSERFYANELQKVEVGTLVPRRQTEPVIRVDDGKRAPVRIPVPALQERKRGARTTRAPARFRDRVSSGSSSDEQQPHEDGIDEEKGSADDDDDNDHDGGRDGEDDEDDNDDTLAQQTRRGRLVRRPRRFVER
jgi:transposase InsO family protein